MPDLELDATSLPLHLSWIGKSAMLNSLPSPRSTLRTAKSDALAECNSIALGSVQALQRSRVPNWPERVDRELAIGAYHASQVGGNSAKAKRKRAGASGGDGDAEPLDPEPLDVELSLIHI